LASARWAAHSLAKKSTNARTEGIFRAIRDPSLAMTGDGAAEIHVEHTNGGIHANAVWQAIIDAALVETNPSAHQS
jgi:hypothetical protein